MNAYSSDKRGGPSVVTGACIDKGCSAFDGSEGSADVTVWLTK